MEKVIKQTKTHVRRVLPLRPRPEVTVRWADVCAAVDGRLMPRS